MGSLADADVIQDSGPVEEAKATPAKVVDKPVETAKTEVAKEGEEKPAKDDSSLKEPEKKSEDKQKSKYAQERERREATWEKINAEKAALQAEKERIAKEREDIRIAAIKSQPFRDQHGHTAADYEAFAETAKKAGDTANAEAALKAAQAVRQQETQVKQETSAKELQSKWAENYNRLATDHPDLKNKDSEMYKSVVGMIEKHPLLLSDPSGINLAVEAVLLQARHKEIQTVSEENRNLKSQIETLNKKLSLSSATPPEPAKAEPEFDKLSREQQFAQIQRQIEGDPDWMSRF